MSAPAMTVVVPTRDRQEQLARCLRALASADRPAGGVEVIVVNDGGASPPPSLLDWTAAGLDVRLLDQARAGPATARNAGAAAARGRFLVFTDDDCEAAPDWLLALERQLAADPDSVAGGRVVASNPENVWATVSQLLIDHLYGWYNRDPWHARFVTSNNLAMTAATFREVGGFDTRFPTAAAEDREFAERTLRSGHGVVFLPEAVVRHRHRLDGRAFVGQHYGYGRGAYRLLRVRREVGGGMVLESPRFYADLLRASRGQKGAMRVLSLGVLLFLSQLAHSAGFAREALARRPR
jgi:GT2 family glycosyltransferase